MKICTKCGTTKSLDEFHKHSRARDGRQGQCKTCHYKATKANKQANRERVNANARRRGKQAWAEDPIHRQKSFEGGMKRKYGLIFERYQALWEAQEGQCAICGRNILCGQAPDRKSRPEYAFIDHDHITGKVRALLCHQCNVGIGYLDDSADRLEKAAVYIRFHES